MTTTPTPTSCAADLPEALRPVEPVALIASIQELNAWEARADGELLTQAEGESIILVLHELKRLLALAAGQATAARAISAEPARAVSETVNFTDRSTVSPIEKARRYLTHVANKKPNNPYFFNDGYPRERVADDAAAALSVLEQLAASHGQAPAGAGKPTEQQILEAAFAPAQPVAEPSRFGSPELQAMIIARCVEKDQADSGFDYKTAADFLSGKTVSDEALRKFVAASRGAHDARAALHAKMLSLQGELASREAEIALLKRSLLDAEADAAAPQPPTAPATQQAGAEPPGIQALMCVISSLRDIAHFSDEEGGELMSALCALRDWAHAQTVAAPQPSPTAQSADSVPAVSDLPPLPEPDLRDVGTKPQEIKEFLKGYATEYARTAIAARAPADSVQEDAARLDWLEQNLFHREKDEWDTKFGGYKEYNMWVLFSPKGIHGRARDIIDAARKQGATQ